jgi:hypothetical protein
VTQLPTKTGRQPGVAELTVVTAGSVADLDADAVPTLPRSAGPATGPRRQLAAQSIVRRDASAAYGGLLVTALIAVQWHSSTPPEYIAFTVVVSVLVFWLTHVWAQVAERRMSGPVSRSEVVRIASREAGMVAAAVPPILALGLARLGAVSVDQAIALALVVCVVQLFLLGLAIGRALGRGWPAALGVAAVECGLGGLLVGLKVVVVH